MNIDSRLLSYYIDAVYADVLRADMTNQLTRPILELTDGAVQARVDPPGVAVHEVVDEFTIHPLDRP